MSDTMNGNIQKDSTQTNNVQIDRMMLAEFIRAARAVKTGFVLCAPRFASGSQGDMLGKAAEKIDDLADALVKQMASPQ